MFPIKKLERRERLKCLRPTKFPNSNGMYNICGQCMPCRITKRKEWETRLMLEWKTQKEGAFVTLTYAPENLPEAEKWKGGNLDKRDLQLFMKRFRITYNRKYGKTKIRHFGVGEFGDLSERAHFHILLFGASAQTIEYIAKKAWTKGHIQVGELHKNRIKYTVGYTIKKLTDKKKIPDGRNPEFAIMSRKPPIGYYAIPQFAKAIKKRKLFPERAFTLDERLNLRDNFIKMGMKKWSGQYYGNDKTYYRLDTRMLRKIAEQAYPEICQFVNINLEGNDTIDELKKRKVYYNRLTDETLLDKIEFETSEEKVDGEKKTAKIERREIKKGTL